MLELVVVIMLIGTLLVFALSRLAGYVAEAERVAVLTLEGEIRNTLVLEAAKRILDKNHGLSSLQGSNPMELMLEAPINYVGELDPVAARSVRRRQWFFDLQTHQLVYRRADQSHPSAPSDLRYEVRVAYRDRDGDGDYVASRDELLGVRLYQVAGW